MQKNIFSIQDPNAKAHSEQLIAYIKNIMQQSAGTISFSDFMQLALYAPALGYYTAGSHKIGREGDFITAPEISNLFSRTLAKQCAEILGNLDNGDILEFGAGSGRMAAAILLELEKQNCLPKHYYILDISPDLRDRQKTLLMNLCPHLLERVIWLNRLPENFSGVMLANEVLDAMPVNLFQWDGEKLQEGFVTTDKNNFVLEWMNPTDYLLAAFSTLRNINQNWELPYQSEINLLLPGWLRSISAALKQGVLILIDYGFPRHEYYLAERKMGTLMCHYQHQAHTDPLILCGLQDITAHVDFTAVIEHAARAGFTLEGYTTQANFLINCGIQNLMQMDDDTKIKSQEAQEIKMLTLPSEMGELFKVMGLSKNYDGFLMGFDHNDLSQRL